MSETRLKCLLKGHFDAVVGRLVLMYQADPIAMLRRLSRLLRRGGVIAFQEFDISAARSFPPCRTFGQSVKWIEAAFAKAGTDTQMGLKLYSAFVAAGISPPDMSLDAGIWGGAAKPGAALARGVVRTLLPVLVQYGIATQKEVGIDSLQQRIE